MRRLTTIVEPFDLRRPFSISTGSIDRLVVLSVEIRDGVHVGRGECVPSAANMVSEKAGRRFADTARCEIESVASKIQEGITREDLLELLPAGPARNAVDCALWDLEAKTSGRRIADLLDIRSPAVLTTAVSIPLSDPVTMGENARLLNDHPLIKLKLGSDADAACVASVRQACPYADVIVDVNGAWTIGQLEAMLPELKRWRVRLIEQPLRAGHDDALIDFVSGIPLCADESCRDRQDIANSVGRYDFINIKLDKCGGLTEALSMIAEAGERGLGLMVGSMCGTSLSMVPAGIVGRFCEFIDLDGPLLLKNDRDAALEYRHGRVDFDRPDIWG